MRCGSRRRSHRAKTTGFPEFDRFLRLWDQRKMSRTLARELLKLQFSPEDNARSHELAVRNKEGVITPADAGDGRG
jgi:hypothetical protein